MAAPDLTDIDHVVLTATDVDATVEFYERVLGMEPRSFPAERGGLRWALHFGERKINLHPAGAEFEPFAAGARPGCVDLCLLTRTPIQEVRDHLVANDVEIALDIDSADGATGALTSIWLRDPDGNLIEVANAREPA